jgi:hypothetical protein
MKLRACTARVAAGVWCAAVVVVSTGSGCEDSNTSPPTWEPVKATVSGVQKAQLDEAVAARDEMFQTIVGALTSEIAEHGPAAAIEVCRDKAPQIAREVAASRGVQIGRTSWKLRNPSNVAPEWAATVVANKPEEPRYVHSTDGRFGAVLPIRVSGLCLMCHGSTDQIPEDVRAKLAQHYPTDQATGFRDGDLRGWFWVEVPARGK